MTLCTVILCATLGGILGGVAAFLVNITFLGRAYLHEQEEIGRGSFCAIGGINAILGITGAFVVQLALILLNKFPKNSGTDDIMFMFGLAVVGGFGARRFLPIMVVNLEEAMRRMFAEAQRNRQEIRETEHKLDQVQKQSERQNEEHLFILTAQSALGEAGTEVQRRWAVEKLEALEKRDALDANGYVILGRLHRRLGDLRKAIAVLTKYINQHQKVDAPHPGYHAALYNRACYYSLLFKEIKDSAYVDHALSDLRLSLTYSPNRESDVAFARGDPDFESIASDARFLELTANTITPAGAGATS